MKLQPIGISMTVLWLLKAIFISFLSAALRPLQLKLESRPPGAAHVAAKYLPAALRWAVSGASSFIKIVLQTKTRCNDFGVASCSKQPQTSQRGEIEQQEPTLEIITYIP